MTSAQGRLRKWQFKLDFAAKRPLLTSNVTHWHLQRRKITGPGRETGCKIGYFEMLICYDRSETELRKKKPLPYAGANAQNKNKKCFATIPGAQAVSAHDARSAVLQAFHCVAREAENAQLVHR